MGLTEFGTSFILGLLTPLTAVCVLPLYPAFVSFLASKFDENANKRTYALFGFVIVLGVLLFMTLLGIIFTTLLQDSLTKIIGVVSPIAFFILGIISLFLIFDFDFSKYLRVLGKINVNTQGRNPLWSAFLFGFFFGAIVIPCNPAFIATFFTRALLFNNFLNSILNFVFFGIGLGMPLLLFSLASAKWSSDVIRFLTRHKRKINLAAGLIMLGISVYYLVFVFEVFG